MALTLLLRCTDLERTRAFYAALPGFDASASAGDTLTITGHGARLVFTAADLWSRAPTLTGTLYFTVDDIDACFAQVQGRAQLAWSLQDMPYGAREFGIVDCNGYILAFQQGA
ncbi:VOC family protein [Luteimonas sp. 3794]|uniref:VOC family protein n=1 Tax=Luteimonas sp. 3794 TaxID=2817730 RepID=UPI002863EF69|nr:VOC family protein [Luteimonas sp. 3794]MDR6990997.1 catechol 2,3-dioxygenase-like lactoylglutathione lyase family enzyme [Luteimonas sp. 3794]